MLKLSDVLKKVVKGINFQRSERVNGEWVNETIDIHAVKATILPKDENDLTPPVYYNMWVKSFTTDDELDKALDYLTSKSLTILTSDSSTYTHKDDDGNESSFRFMVVSS